MLSFYTILFAILLARPKTLLQSIAESLNLGGLSRASSRASLTSLSSTTNAVITSATKNSDTSDKGVGDSEGSVKDFEPYEPPRRAVTCKNHTFFLLIYFFNV